MMPEVTVPTYHTYAVILNSRIQFPYYTSKTTEQWQAVWWFLQRRESRIYPFNHLLPLSGAKKWCIWIQIERKTIWVGSEEKSIQPVVSGVGHDGHNQLDVRGGGLLDGPQVGLRPLYNRLIVITNMCKSFVFKHFCTGTYPGTK